MRVISILLIAVYMSCTATIALASEENEKVYLIQMLNQLEALKPLIIAASKEQQNNSRIKFHYTNFINTNGKTQNGLLEDINELEKGIQARINNTEIEPHRFVPIKGDYVSHDLKLGS